MSAYAGTLGLSTRMDEVRRAQPCPHVQNGRCAQGKGCANMHPATSAVAVAKRAPPRVEGKPRDPQPDRCRHDRIGRVQIKFGGARRPHVRPNFGPDPEIPWPKLAAFGRLKQASVDNGQDLSNFHRVGAKAGQAWSNPGRPELGPSGPKSTDFDPLRALPAAFGPAFPEFASLRNSREVGIPGPREARECPRQLDQVSPEYVHEDPNVEPRAPMTEPP